MASNIHYNWINVSYFEILQTRLNYEFVFYSYQALLKARGGLHYLMILSVLKGLN